MSVSDLRTRLHELADAVPAARDDPTAAVARRVRRHRQRVLGGMGAAVVVAVAAASIALWIGDRGPKARRVTTGPIQVAGSATAQQLARFHWSQLPPAPIQPRSDASVAWTGKELVVWGGVVVGHTAIPKGDGAAFDPASNQWRGIASPERVDSRWHAVTLWTGTEMLVVGGEGLDSNALPSTDGAYDPSTDRWRLLSPRPAGLGGSSTGRWDGHEALVLAGAWDGQEALFVSSNRSAVAYEPTTDRWRSLPSLPEPPGRVLAAITPVWTGERLLVWTEWSHTTSVGNETTGSAGVDVWAYDPRSDAWTPGTQLENGSSGLDGPGGVSAALWTGREVVLPASRDFPGSAAGGGLGPDGMGLHGFRYDPLTRTYRAIAHARIDDGSRDWVWTGGALVRTSQAGSSGPGLPLQPGDAAAWDPATDSWTPLPPAPVPGSDRQLVWTGHEILSYGQDIGFRFGP
jgi:hypothetical protein